MAARSSYKILVLPGDGIGPEVTREALRVFEKVAGQEQVSLKLEEALVGGASIEAHGEPLTAQTLDKARAADAVLLGAVGGPRWDDRPQAQRPEQGLLQLRAGLELFANLRPARVFQPLIESSTLRSEVIAPIDLIVVRELTGGLYFGQPSGREVRNQQRVAFNTMIYSEPEIERVARRAFEIAAQRRRKVTSVDKANILACSALWREVVSEVGRDFPEVMLEHMYVDNCAMQLVRHPGQFDVLLTENMFGDILSDEAAMLTGSIGMLPSASLGVRQNARGHPLGLYEPVHGSAPDIAGQGRANPLATILSVAMLWRFSLGNESAAQRIETAVAAVLATGARTADLARGGETVVSTAEMGERVLTQLS